MGAEGHETYSTRHKWQFQFLIDRQISIYIARQYLELNIK